MFNEIFRKPDDREWEAIMRQVWPTQSWTDEEVAGFANDPRELTSDLVMGYLDGALSAEGCLAVEARAAVCAFSSEQLAGWADLLAEHKRTAHPPTIIPISPKPPKTFPSGVAAVASSMVFNSASPGKRVPASSKPPHQSVEQQHPSELPSAQSHLPRNATGGTMHFERNCPSCDTRLRIRIEAVGRTVPCPRCKQPFTVADQPTVAAIDSGSPPYPRRPRVFISHAHEDRTFVEQTIRPLFANHGVETWWSKVDIRGGEPWEEALKTGMQESDWCLVLLSPQSAKSNWVQKEIGWALANKPHRILPVLKEPCDLKAFPEAINSLHFIDCTRNMKSAGRQILADMIRQLNKETQQHQEKVEQLSRLAEALKEENADLSRAHQEITARLNRVIAFDGMWTEPRPVDPPPFRPLKQGAAPIIAVVNLKGGVGKTTLTANIAASLWSNEPKQRVLLIDLDYQANLTQNSLDQRTVARLRRQDRLVHTLFGERLPDPRALLHCVEPIFDHRERATEGYVVGSDEFLWNYETLALTRWLAGLYDDDIRFRLRRLLHAEEVQRDYHCILLDCPPRLTTTCINALLAADFILIPVMLDKKGTEAAPRLLRWLRERKESLFANLVGVGVVANRTRDVDREQGEWDDLLTDCRDAWKENGCGFNTFIPVFTEQAMALKFPACHRSLRDTFARLVRELMERVGAPVEVRS